MKINNSLYEIDKIMSKRIEEIFSDPARHKFYSSFDQDENEDRRGPRGGKIGGKKRVCVHCGHVKGVHAQETEQL